MEADGDKEMQTKMTMTGEARVGPDSTAIAEDVATKYAHIICKIFGACSWHEMRPRVLHPVDRVGD